MGRGATDSNHAGSPRRVGVGLGWLVLGTLIWAAGRSVLEQAGAVIDSRAVWIAAATALGLVSQGFAVYGAWLATGRSGTDGPSPVRFAARGALVGAAVLSVAIPPAYLYWPTLPLPLIDPMTFYRLLDRGHDGSGLVWLLGLLLLGVTLPPAC